MPELPEVETIRRDLRRVIRGKKFKQVRVRTPKLVRGAARTFAAKLKGRTIKNVDRRGKLLMIELAGDQWLLVHLKMTGQLIYRDGRRTIAGGHSYPAITTLPNAYTHLEFHFTDRSVLYFNDLRQFGYVALVSTTKKKAIEDTYGIEPLTPAFTRQNFSQIVQARHTALKAVLLDQTKIAGLGNIYVDEACWLAKVRPDRRASTLTRLELGRLHRACESIIARAIRYRGTTFDRYRDGRGRPGNYTRLLKAYGRGGKECLRCGKSTIAKVKVGGRGTTFCANCQQ